MAERFQILSNTLLRLEAVLDGHLWTNEDASAGVYLENLQYKLFVFEEFATADNFWHNAEERSDVQYDFITVVRSIDDQIQQLFDRRSAINVTTKLYETASDLKLRLWSLHETIEEYHRDKQETLVEAARPLLDPEPPDSHDFELGGSELHGSSASRSGSVELGEEVPLMQSDSEVSSSGTIPRGSRASEVTPSTHERDYHYAPTLVSVPSLRSDPESNPSNVSLLTSLGSAVSGVPQFEPSLSGEASLTGSTRYKCFAGFLACQAGNFHDYDDWDTHCRSHFRMYGPPIGGSKCPYCDFEVRPQDLGEAPTPRGPLSARYIAACEKRAREEGATPYQQEEPYRLQANELWSLRQKHVAQHFEQDPSEPPAAKDLEMCEYMWKKSLITDATYKDLASGSDLSIPQASRSRNRISAFVEKGGGLTKEEQTLYHSSDNSENTPVREGGKGKGKEVRLNSTEGRAKPRLWYRSSAEEAPPRNQPVSDKHFP